ncbi:MAG: hypothetical protein V8Q27_01715 [Eubacteriales bacterium]
MKENLAKKQTGSYREYEPVTVEADRYAGRGFVWSMRGWMPGPLPGGIISEK